MEQSNQQQEAITAVKKWFWNPKRPQIFRLFGYAGTGKTTLAKHLADEIGGDALFASFTGKAAQVLRTKGCFGASTIHSLIYRPIVNEKTGIVDFVLNWDSPLAATKLLVVDEVSMVGEDLARDLLRFKKPILVLGDPAQLPPIKDAGYFINAEPDILLTEVHRQAQNNPIIKASMDIRQGKNPEAGSNDMGSFHIIQRKDIDISTLAELCVASDQVLCGRNQTRITLNNLIRKTLGIESVYPVVGDRLVCLKNDKNVGVFNGSLQEVIKSSIDRKDSKIDMELKSVDTDSYVKVSVFKEFFTGEESKLDQKVLRGTQHFTYGYALTVHKSQGSQWDNVFVYDESSIFGQDSGKHLYTAVTRAAKNLTLLV